MLLSGAAGAGLGRAGMGGGPWRGIGVEAGGEFAGLAGAWAGPAVPALDESGLDGGMPAPGGMGVPAGKSLADRKPLVAGAS